MSSWANLNLQNGVSPLMEQMIFFHDHAMSIMLGVTITVAYSMTSMLLVRFSDRYSLEHQSLETVWTILPAVTLITIAFPSLELLYLMDDSIEPELTIKSIGHQWYWSYEYCDFPQNIEFDSYLIPTPELSENGFRLLDVDNRMVIPMQTQIRMLITAADVIHSWTIPALGLKVDGTPGRMNQMTFLINRPGLYYGQCSEICGANHSFMPIVVESVKTPIFTNWISNIA